MLRGLREMLREVLRFKGSVKNRATRFRRMIRVVLRVKRNVGRCGTV